MNEQPRPTETQIELIKKLDNLKFDIWNSKTTEEIIEIANKAIAFSKNVEPATYILANGIAKIDNKGKSLIMEVLKSDIQGLESRSYSTIEDEKFAIVSSIQILIGVFVHLTGDEMFKLLRK